MNEQVKFILLFIAFFGSFASCAIATDEVTAKAQKEVQSCRNGYKRSAPSCWNEADWIEYCKHVECK